MREVDLHNVMDLLKGLWGGDVDQAVSFVNNPVEQLTAVGGDQLTVEDFREVLVELSPELSYQAQAAAQQYLESHPALSGGYGGGDPTPQVIREILEVTRNTYVDQTLQQTIDNSRYYDNSVEFDINAEHGDVDVDFDQTLANGDGAVAIGGAVLGGQIQTGNGLQAGGDLDIDDSAVNTGEFTGAQSGSGDANAVTGDGNQVAQDVDLDDGSALAVGGDANASNIQDSSLENSGVASGGDANVIAGNDDSAANIGDGNDVSNISDIDDSAVSTGGDATNTQDSFNQDTHNTDSFNQDQTIDLDQSQDIIEVDRSNVLHSDLETGEDPAELVD
jgi:hypothetical protein